MRIQCRPKNGPILWVADEEFTFDFLTWSADNFDALCDLKKKRLHFHLPVRPFFEDFTMNLIDYIVT